MSHRLSLLVGIVLCAATGLASAQAITTPATSKITADGGTSGPFEHSSCLETDQSTQDSEGVTANCGYLGDLGLGMVGNVNVQGEIASSAWPDFVYTNSAAEVRFQFSINLGALAAPPFNLQSFPVRFSAKGEIEVTTDSPGQQALGGAGASAGIIAVSESGVVVLDVSIGLRDTTGGSDSFSETRTVQLNNGIYEGYAFAQGYAAARCGVIPDNDVCQVSRASYTATVDPWVEFDQQAFDDLYGPESFLLSDYYRIDFSPNIPDSSTSAPAPSALALLAFGLCAAGLTRRRDPRG